MAEFGELLEELRDGLDDPEAFHERLRIALDANLVDRIRGFGAAREATSAEIVLRALEWFMFSTAQRAWRDISASSADEAASKDVALTFVVERYLASAMGDARQDLLEGERARTPLRLFQREP